MTIGPEPISRILLSSLFRGICASADSKRNHAKVTRELYQCHPERKARDLSQDEKFTHRTLRAKSFEGEIPRRLARLGMTARYLRHLRHALPIQPDLANTFDAREDVINRLATNAD